MKKIQLVLFALVALCLVSNAYALTQAPKAGTQWLCKDDADTDGPYPGKWTWGTCDSYNVIDGTSLASAADELTIATDVKGYGKVIQVISVVDANASSTRLDINCSGSMDGGTIYGTEQSKSITSGVSTLSAYEEQKALSAGTTSFVTPFDVRGYSHFKCIYDVTGTAAATDVITVQWSKVIGD